MIVDPVNRYQYAARRAPDRAGCWVIWRLDVEPGKPRREWAGQPITHEQLRISRHAAGELESLLTHAFWLGRCQGREDHRPASGPAPL